MSDHLLDEIKSSIVDMQAQMQNTYSNLSEMKLEGESSDKTVKIIMSATYAFEDIIFTEQAFQGGIKEFKWRLREAWKNLSENIQKTTQQKTVELLQGMNIPDEIRNISIEDQTDEGSQGGKGDQSGEGGRTIDG